MTAGLIVYLIGCFLAGRAMVIIVDALRDNETASRLREEERQQLQSIRLTEWLRGTSHDEAGR